MSTEWTIERFEALPVGTVIEWKYDYEVTSPLIVRDVRGWRDVFGRFWSSRDLEHSLLRLIRVVSVPIDALLAEDACLAARSVPMHTERGMTHETIRLAIAHVTGGQP